MPSLTAKDRVSLCLFTFTDGRRCRTPTHQQPSALLLLPRPKRIPITVRREISQRAILFLLRRLPLRLRSQHRSEPPNPRRCPRRNQTPRSPHRSLHAPTPNAVLPPSPTRIHQRLQHRRLAQRHLPLRQSQLQIPPPAKAQTTNPISRPIRPHNSTSTTAATTTHCHNAATSTANPPLTRRHRSSPSSRPLHISSPPNDAPPPSHPPTPNAVARTPQPTSTPTIPTPPLAAPSAVGGFSRRRPHNVSINSFGTNIYTRPGNR